MADVRIANYVLSSDTHGWSVTEIKQKQETGEEYRGHSTYYGDMSQALSGLLGRRLRASEATTIAQLKADLDTIRAEILNAMGVRV